MISVESLQESGRPLPQHAPGFTPVRRPDKEQPLDSPAAGLQAPWTTARCNRLLRPISSRIALLRKNRRLPHASTTQRYRDGILTGTKASSRISTHLSESDVHVRHQMQPRDTKDPDWEPEERPRKRIKKTYSAKGAALGKEDFDCGKTSKPVTLGIPSPFVRRKITRDDSPSVIDDHREGSITGDPPVHNAEYCGSIAEEHKGTVLDKTCKRENFRVLAKSTSPSQWMLFEGLYISLEALLRATAGSGNVRVGARSLFSQCLRKVPEYISAEISLAAEENEGAELNEDITTAIYDDIESLGTAATGRRPLKQIVRSHGILLLQEAIRDGSLPPAIARALTLHCLQFDAFEEAESLCAEMLGCLTGLPLPSDPGTMGLFQHCGPAMRTLKESWIKCGRLGFVYRSLIALLRSGIVSIDWMGDLDMACILSKAIRSITQRDQYAQEASEFALTVTLLSCSGSLLDVSEAIHLLRLGRPCTSIFARQNSTSWKARHQKIQKDHKSGSRPRLDEVVTKTISSVVSVVSSLAACTTDTIPDLLASNNRKNSQAFLRSLVLQATQLDEISRWIECHGAYETFDKTRTSLPSLGFALVSRRADNFKEEIGLERTALPLLPSSLDNSVINVQSSFLNSLAVCHSEMDGFSVLSHLQRLVGNLLAMAEPCSSFSQSQCSVARKVAVAAAFEFAEAKPATPNLNWALEVEDLAEQMTLDADTVSSSIDSKGNLRDPEKWGEAHLAERKLEFRWEECIGEWVSRTPAATERRKNNAVVVIPRQPSLSLTRPSRHASTDTCSLHRTGASSASSSLSSSASTPRSSAAPSTRASSPDESYLEILSRKQRAVKRPVGCQQEPRPRGRPPRSGMSQASQARSPAEIGDCRDFMSQRLRASTTGQTKDSLLPRASSLPQTIVGPKIPGIQVRIPRRSALGDIAGSALNSVDNALVRRQQPRTLSTLIAADLDLSDDELGF